MRFSPGGKAEMKRRLENATQTPSDLVSQDGPESTPELLNAPDLPDAPELLTIDDAGLLTPIQADLSLPEWGAARAQSASLRKLRLLWSRRQLMLYWAVAGCCAAVVLALVIPKQYVSSAKLMPPETQSTSKLAGGFGSIASGLMGISSSGAMLVALMCSRTIEDRMIERFNLKQVYRVRLQQDAYTRLQAKTSFSVEPKSGIVALSVTDGDPQRAAAMARAYVEELGVLMTQLNNSSAHRERVFLQDELQVVKVEMEKAEKDFSEFASKNGAMDITEQGRVMIDGSVKIRGELIAEESQLEEMRQIYSDSSPRVHVLQARISELVNQQKRLLGTYTGKSFAEGQASGGSFPSLRQLPILGVPYRKFQKLKIEEAVYETLRRELDSAMMQEARENPTVEILDLPVVPDRKSFPPRLLIIATGTGCALILSGVWILGVARWREIGAHHPGRILAREIFGTVRWRIVVAATSDAEQDQSDKSDGNTDGRTKAQSA
jgi:capsule polysaccharide export protein KpsE/RkpR